MKNRNTAAGVFALALAAPAYLAGAPVNAEAVIWGIQAEQLEYRTGDGSNILAWDFDAVVGTDELKFVWRSEAEYALDDDVFETFENQARLQMPISDFFDGVFGVRVDTPEGPDRVYGVIGVHGLAPQWFEIDADLFLSDKPTFRFEAEYEALITNRIILTPSFEVDLPLVDDKAIGVSAFGPKLEVGARLSYDLVDRAISPYIGIHYERVFGETADLARADGDDVDGIFFVVGTRIMF
jgi:copper resistance protein B